MAQHRTSPSGAPTAVSGTANRSRILGVDTARGIAVLGMLVVNSRLGAENGGAGPVWQLAHGRASLLFMVLAGLGVSLVAGRRPGEGRWRTTLWRVAVLAVLAWGLEQLDHDAKVILATYAVLFLVAPLLVRLRAGALVVVTAAVTLGGPPLLLVWHHLRELSLDRGAAGGTTGPLQLTEDLLVTGGYPLLTWLAPFTLGMLLGRLDLRDPRTWRRMTLVGALVVVVTVGVSRALTAILGTPHGTTPEVRHLLVTTAHSQMPLWLVSGTAAAVTVLGLALWATDRAPRLLAPLVATGRLALTVYVGHLVLLALVPTGEPVDVAGVPVPVGLLLCAGAVLLPVAWLRVARQGPLEAALRPPWTRRRTD